MSAEAGTSHTMKVHHYYKCFTAQRKRTCDKKNVKKDWIENLVIDETMKMLFNDALMESIADKLIEVQCQENTTLPLLKQQLEEAEKGIQNVLNAIQAGIFTTSTKQRLDELEDTKSKLEVSILQEKMHKPMLSKEQILFWLHRFRKTDINDQEQRQKLVDSFVNAVYLYEDRLILTFNYKDGAKTITLADIQGSNLQSGGAP